MADDIFAMLGHDPNSPKVKDAAEDAEAAGRLVEYLVTLRESQGRTVEQVAEFMETTADDVRELERAGSDPYLSELQRYARAICADINVDIYLLCHKNFGAECEDHV